MASASHHQIRPGSLVLGRYTVECLVGVGGMGSVFKARDTDGSIVAIKVLARNEGHFSERFVREADMLRQLEHPAIVRCMENGVTESEDRVLVLEWLDGIDLANRLRIKPFSLAEVLELIARVADALQFAHTCGMVHRDVKPGNIFLPGGAVGQTKLLDFGMARWSAAKALTVTGTQMGTPAYMAPEQIRGERHIGPRADIFSLGCVFFECLTGRPAFAGEHTMAVFYKILVEPTPTLTQAVVQGIPDIVALVERMLAKHVTDRPRSCSEVASELSAILARLPSDAAGALLERGARRNDAITATEQHLVNVIVVAASPSGEDMWRTAAQLAGRDEPTELLGLGEMLTQMPDKTPRRPVDHTPSQALGHTRTVHDTADDGYLADTRVGSEHRPQGAAADIDVADMNRLGSRLAAFGARLDCLRDGSIIAVLDARQTATDQAINAARCALELRHTLPARPMALATGRAVVGQRQLIGEVIDRAVELLAAPVTVDPEHPRRADAVQPIRIDDLTAGLLGARFVVERDRGGLVLCAEAETRRPRTLLGKSTPFVGRRREKAALVATLEECVEDEIARAVLVLGPPGYGKSRLEREFSRQLADSNQDLEIWRCGGDPMRAGLPLDLLAQLIRSAAAIEASEPIDVKQRKLRRRVAELVTDDSATRVSVFLAELIKAPFTDSDDVQLKAARANPRLMGDQIRRAAEDLLAAAVRCRPLILMLEDLHWGDRATVSVLDLALRHLSEKPLMVLAFARPEVHDSFPALWSTHELVVVKLERLAARAAKTLARSVLGQDVPDERVDALVERAAGNAFYLEELVRGAAAGQWQLPDTVLAMVHSRLEALDATARRVLRGGSIFGDSFWRGGVSALLGGEVAVDPVLEDLVSHELISRRVRSRFPDEVEYEFHHNLIREAAYGMLTVEDRTRGHRLAGQWLQRAGEGDAKVVAEQLARGDAPAEALPFFLRAAEGALEAGAFGVAIELAERGVGCRAQTQTLGELRRVQVDAHYWRSENADACRVGVEAMELLSLGSRGWYSAAAATVVAWARLGEVDKLEAFADVLARSRHPGHDRDGWMMAASQQAKALFLHSRVAFAERVLERIEAEITDMNAEDPAVAARVHRARADRALVAGDPATNLFETQRAVERFERAGDLRQACMERISYGYSMLELGLHAEAVSDLRAALETAEHMGLATAIDYAKHNLCLALAYQGQLPEAMELARSAAVSYREQDNNRMAAATLAYLAMMLSMDDDLEQAESVARDALALETESTPTRCMVLAILSRVLRLHGKLSEAMDKADDALALMYALGAIDEGEALVRLARAEALLAMGHEAEARDAVIHARDRLHERASGIARADWRLAFLENIPEHAHTIALAQRLGI